MAEQSASTSRYRPVHSHVEPDAARPGEVLMAHERKFRFAVQLHSASTAKGWADTARRAEDLGFSTLFLPDHFGDQLAPAPALMAVADATTSLRVGALVFDNDYRAPGAAGQGDGDARRPVRRPGRARTRRRVAEQRLRAVGHPAGPTGGAGRPHGGGHHRPQGLVRRRAPHLPRRALHDHGPERPAEADPVTAPAVPDRRRQEAGAHHRRSGGRHRRHQPHDAQR